MARPSKRTQEAQAVILQAVGGGAARVDAAAYAGMAYETLRRWLNEDEAFRGAVERAEGTIGVRLGATLMQMAFGQEAVFDPDGNQVRPYRGPNLEALKYLASHHPQLRQQWGDTLRVDVHSMAAKAADNAGLPRDEVMAELASILELSEAP